MNYIFLLIYINNEKLLLMSSKTSNSCYNQYGLDISALWKTNDVNQNINHYMNNNSCNNYQSYNGFQTPSSTGYKCGGIGGTRDGRFSVPNIPVIPFSQ